MTEPGVTPTVFDTLPTAEIACGWPRVEGIACVLADRSLLPLDLVADSIELRVPASQLEQARAVLERDYSGKLGFES